MRSIAQSRSLRLLARLRIVERLLFVACHLQSRLVLTLDTSVAATATADVVAAEAGTATADVEAAVAGMETTNVAAVVADMAQREKDGKEARLEAHV